MTLVAPPPAAAMARDYSDLEVVENQDTREEKVVYGFTTVSKPYDPYDTENSVVYPAKAALPPRRICRLPVKMFWIVFGATVVLVAGGLGAGLGVVLSKKNQGASSPIPIDHSSTTSTASISTPGSVATSATTSASTSTTASTTTTTSISVSLTTKTMALPSGRGTVWSDCPSANNTIFNALDSDKYQFRKICGSTYRGSTVNLVDEPASSLDDCIGLCVAYNVKYKGAIDAGTSRTCNSVCWRNDQDQLGRCFGSTYQNSSTAGFVYGYLEWCDSGAWINQS